MSGQEGWDREGPPSDVDERILGTIDEAPYTAREVADAVGVSRDLATRRLDALVAAGELAVKAVGETDLRLWYRPEAPEWVPGDRDGDHSPSRESAGGSGRAGRTDDERNPAGGGEVASAGADEPALSGTGGSAGEAVDLPSDLAAAVEAADVPGSSELMCAWRRDALRAAATLLVVERSVTREDFRREVYRAHPAGYDSFEAWWRAIRDCLVALPDVVSIDDETFRLGPV